MKVWVSKFSTCIQYFKFIFSIIPSYPHWNLCKTGFFKNTEFSLILNTSPKIVFILLDIIFIHSLRWYKNLIIFSIYCIKLCCMKCKLDFAKLCTFKFPLLLLFHTYKLNSEISPCNLCQWILQTLTLRFKT